MATFSSLIHHVTDPQRLTERALMSSLNDTTNVINKQATPKFPGQAVTPDLRTVQNWQQTWSLKTDVK